MNDEYMAVICKKRVKSMTRERNETFHFSHIMKNFVHKGTMGRFTLLAGLVVLTCGMASGASRVKAYVEGKKKAYQQEVGGIDAEFEKKSQERQKKIQTLIVSMIKSAAGEGKLDDAEEFYKVKTGIERGKIVDAVGLAPLKDNASAVEALLQEQRNVEEECFSRISEINQKYLNQCRDLLRKPKDFNMDEFNELLTYKYQLILPKGAVFSQQGRKQGVLTCRVYKGEFSDLASIENGICLVQTHTPCPGILWGMPKENSGVIWTGEYYAERSGEYEFTLSADDMASLRLGGSLIEAGTHVAGKSFLFLTRGWHPLELRYIQRKGQLSLDLEVKKPDQEKSEEIPPSSFSVNTEAAQKVIR